MYFELFKDKNTNLINKKLEKGFRVWKKTKIFVFYLRRLSLGLPSKTISNNFKQKYLFYFSYLKIELCLKYPKFGGIRKE